MLQSLSIRTLLEKIESNDILIPNMQREFVWKSSQMLALLDSLRRDIPIQSFIFWRTKENLLCKNIKNEKIDTFGNEKVYILDGQQRIKSIYSLFSGAGAFITNSLDIKVGGKLPVNCVPLSILLKENVTSTTDVFEALSIKRDSGLERLVNELLLLIDREILYFYEIKKTKTIDMFEIFKRINTGGTKLNTPELIKCVFKYSWPESMDEFKKIVNLYKKENIKLNLESIVAGVRVHHFCQNSYGAMTEDVVKHAKSNWKVFKEAYLKVLEFRKDLPLINGSIINMCMLYFLSGKSDKTHLLKYVYSYISNKVFSRSTDTGLIKWCTGIQNNIDPPMLNINYEGIPKNILLNIVYKETMENMYVDKLTEDHIFSKSELKYLGIGAYDNVANLVLLPYYSNNKKSNMSAISFYEKSIYNKQLLIDLPKNLTDDAYKKFIKDRGAAIKQLVMHFINNLTAETTK
jgi:uncharacterized protein with ParB-like and HNH nuclease domain